MGFAQVVRVVSRWSQGGAALCPGLSHLAPLGQWIWPGEFTYADQHHLSVRHCRDEAWSMFCCKIQRASKYFLLMRTMLESATKKRSTPCHLKKLSEKISPKKPHKINAMVSVSPGKSQRRIDLLLRTLLHERFVVLVYRLRVLWMLWRIPWIGQFVPGSQLER